MNLRFETLFPIAVLSALCGCLKSEPTTPQSETPMAVAIDIAVSAMEREMPPEYLEKYKPYRAELVDGVWHVFGTVAGGGPGGSPEARIRDADGVVLSVAHGQ